MNVCIHTVGTTCFRKFCLRQQTDSETESDTRVSKEGCEIGRESRQEAVSMGNLESRAERGDRRRGLRMGERMPGTRHLMVGCVIWACRLLRS